VNVGRRAKNRSAVWRDIADSMREPVRSMERTA
jgi:hypothetical protein